MPNFADSIDRIHFFLRFLRSYSEIMSWKGSCNVFIYRMFLCRFSWSLRDTTICKWVLEIFSVPPCVFIYLCASVCVCTLLSVVFGIKLVLSSSLGFLSIRNKVMIRIVIEADRHKPRACNYVKRYAVHPFYLLYKIVEEG